MDKYKTKYFGEVSFDFDEKVEGWADFFAIFNGKEIMVALSEWGSYGDKQKTCLDIIDKYVEINELAKKAIIDNFPKNEWVNYYFKCHFEDILDDEELIEVFGTKNFKKLDINKVVEKIEYPNLLFEAIKNNKLTFSVDYMVSEEYSDEILCVKMDEDLNIIGFSHES